MSLINDALKKAARQRAEEQAEVAPPPQAGRRRRIPRHGAPLSVKMMVFLAGGAVTLVVASVVITGIFISGRLESRAPAPAPAPAVSPAQQPPPVVAVHAPGPAETPATGPTAPPAAERAAPAPAAPSPAAAASAPRAAEVVAPTSVPAPAPVASPPAAAAPASHGGAPGAAHPPATPPPSRAELVQGFVDSLRVTGVRAAGPDSKALIDGHIYRINDVLERSLGIRLLQVDADHLTLVDSEGVTYTKSF